MRPPRIPPMVTDIVQSALCSLDDAEFTHLAACPVCGGRVQGYDTRTKKYAVIRDGDGERIIKVRIKRFTCKDCKKLCNADEPFYPGTRIGSLVVDLFFCLSATMPESRAARHIGAMGIRVDRTSWKKYSGRAIPEIPVTDIFGMQLPSSVLTLANLSARIPEGGRIDSTDALEACNFPSALTISPCSILAGENTGMRKSNDLPPMNVAPGGVRSPPDGAVSPISSLATSKVRF